MIYLAAFLLSAHGAEPCVQRSAIFGRIIAVCGERNLVYAGDVRASVLGVRTTVSQFELTYCQGGGRFPMTLMPHSEGFRLESPQPEILRYEKGKPSLTQTLEIHHSWGRFWMSVKRSDGASSEIACVEYADSNPNPRYLD